MSPEDMALIAKNIIKVCDQEIPAHNETKAQVSFEGSFEWEHL